MRYRPVCRNVGNAKRGKDRPPRRVPKVRRSLIPFRKQDCNYCGTANSVHRKAEEFP